MFRCHCLRHSPAPPAQNGRHRAIGGSGGRSRSHASETCVSRGVLEQGIADRDRIAIMGGSYGGYATLVGLTLTPEVFACGVDFVGPSI